MIPISSTSLCSWWLPGVGETLSLDHFSDRDETRLSSRSRLRHLQSLSLGLESRNCSLLGLSLSLEVETSLMCYSMCTFLFPMHTSSCLIWPWLNSLVLKTWKFVAPYLEMNPCASLSVSLGLDQKSAVSVSVSTSETFRSQSQSRVSTRQGSGLSLSLNPKNLGLVGCWFIFSST